jgi:hypothetical protein
MSLLNSTLQTAVLRLRDLTGNVTTQKIHNRIFDAYEAKSLVFELITPAQQQVMRQYGGVIPVHHPVGLPTVIDGWPELMAAHNENNIYQLLPRRAKTNASYAVMRAVCSAPNSPFTMDNRSDPLEMKFVFRAADYEYKQAFNQRNTEKVGNNIWFDGILKNETDTGLIMCHHVVSPQHINTMVGTIAFLREWVASESDGDRHMQMKKAWKDMLGKRYHLFCGTSTTPAKDLVAFAKSKNVYLYAKKGGDFQFMV